MGTASVRVVSSAGTDATLELTDDKGGKATQKVALVPYAKDVEDAQTGKLVTIMVDPNDDIAAHLEEYAHAYDRGVAEQAKAVAAVAREVGVVVDVVPEKE